jgi:IS30 family transposase
MSKKTLSERIADQLTAKKETSSGKNKAQFISLKADIEQAINDEWSLRQIYRTLHSEGQLTFSYETFRRYVKKLISIKTPDQKIKEKDLTPEEKNKGKSGFQFNSVADKKDLL